ncbi:hypothetical protein NCC49_003240 [Naganishia albida]|nr:hypothetical protein NCC49_003240 [Naganishia albida]
MLIGLTSRILCNLACFLYPAYASYKALTISPINSQYATRQLERWLMYWAVVGSWVGMEAVGGWILSLIPFYSLFKLMFFLWLSLPQTEGSTYLYNTLLAPAFHEHERDIDAFLSSLKSRVSGALLNVLNWAWARAKQALDLNIDLTRASTSATAEARPVDATPDFRPYPIATSGQPPTLHDPASGVMQQAYSAATRYAFQYLPLVINALQNSRTPASTTSRSGPNASISPVPPPQSEGYDIDSGSRGFDYQQDQDTPPAPSQTLRQAVSGIYASSHTHPSTSDQIDSLSQRRPANLQPNVGRSFGSGSTSRSTSDQEIPTHDSGSSRGSWGVASGYDEIRREELDDAGVSGLPRPGKAQRTSSWFSWSAGGAGQEVKDKTE